MASAIPSLLFCLLVLAPRLGSSSHTSFINGGKQTFVRSSDSRVPTCSPAPSDGGEVPAGRLPVMHRLSPCSPSSAGEGKSMLSAGDAFDRDALRLRAIFRESEPEDSKVGLTIPATGAPLAALPGDAYLESEPEDSKVGLTIPATGAPLAALPGAADYNVVVGFGNPVQKLAVGFDTATVGATLLQCKPCSADGDPCDKFFDPSRSYSLAQIPCASPDCPLRACSEPSSCTFALKKKGAVLVNATVVTDTLTVSRSASANDFREQMREYRRAPPLGELETCYDFSRESSYSVPMITLRFHGGAELVIDHMLYFKDPRNVFGVACLAFAPAPAYAPAGVAVVGSMAQVNMEVVYDVRGGKFYMVTESKGLECMTLPTPTWLHRSHI
uniref:Xylanase inhibitor C-terminal domain-containing protein n=1 Tax=Aegilops tauschii TaxID=37682 RepID=M8CLI6_AEGTA